LKTQARCTAVRNRKDAKGRSGFRLLPRLPSPLSLSSNRDAPLRRSPYDTSSLNASLVSLSDGLYIILHYIAFTKIRLATFEEKLSGISQTRLCLCCIYSTTKLLTCFDFFSFFFSLRRIHFYLLTFEIREIKNAVKLTDFRSMPSFGCTAIICYRWPNADAVVCLVSRLGSMPSPLSRL
jgi:hypothetical protein